MLASEVPPRLFLDDLLLDLPACRVGADSAVHAPDEEMERIDDVQHLFWIGTPPGSDDRARILIDSLRARGLISEPFERATLGLREAFGGSNDVVA
jgi:hypothetical protein